MFGTFLALELEGVSSRERNLRNFTPGVTLNLMQQHEEAR